MKKAVEGVRVPKLITSTCLALTAPPGGPGQPYANDRVFPIEVGYKRCPFRYLLFFNSTIHRSYTPHKAPHKALIWNTTLRKDNHAFPRSLNESHQPSNCFPKLFIRRKKETPLTPIMVDWLGLTVPIAYLSLLIGSLATFSSLYRKRKAGTSPFPPFSQIPLLQPHPTKVTPTHPLSQQNPSPSSPGFRPISTATSTSPSSTSNHPPPMARNPPPYQTACSKPLYSSGPPRISIGSC